MSRAPRFQRFLRNLVIFVVVALVTGGVIIRVADELHDQQVTSDQARAVRGLGVTVEELTIINEGLTRSERRSVRRLTNAREELVVLQYVIAVLSAQIEDLGGTPATREDAASAFPPGTGQPPPSNPPPTTNPPPRPPPVDCPGNSPPPCPHPDPTPGHP